MSDPAERVEFGNPPNEQIHSPHLRSRNNSFLREPSYLVQNESRLSNVTEVHTPPIVSTPIEPAFLSRLAPQTSEEAVGPEPFDASSEVREKWPSPKACPRWYVDRLRGFDQSKCVYGFYPEWDLLLSFVLVCVTLVIFAIIEYYAFVPLMKRLSVFIPAFGASATVVFAVPKVPLAQPRALFCSHLSAAFIGVSCANIFQYASDVEFGFKCAGALAVGLHLVLMSVTNTFHPPASATCVSAALAPINAYYPDQGFLFVICPVLLACCILFVCAWLFNNLFAWRSPYPQYWW